MADATLSELKTALEEKAAFIREGAEKGIKIDGSNVEMKSDDFRALQKAMREHDQIKTLIEAKSIPGSTDAFLHSLRAPVGSSSAVAGYAAGIGGAPTIGAAFVDSPQFKALKASNRLTMDEAFEYDGMDVTGYGQKDIVTGSVTAPAGRGFGRRQFDPMVPRAQRVARVRDLFPVASTSANLIDYFRVLGFVENDGKGNAGTVAEQTGAGTTEDPKVFGLKPKSNLRFESAQAPVRTIAHWEAAHRNVLQDEPQLQSTIDNELLYGLALEEDNQILNGDGTGENLLGILNTPNIQTYAQIAPDQKSDALRRAATLAIIANYPPTGFVLHPNDWEDIELQKATTGDGQYMLTTNFSVGLETRIWRQPLVETPAMTEGTFLTGAFGTGAQLYDRQRANVRIAEQHADFFVRNAVAILAEERIALAVKRPESFVVGTFL